MDFNNCYETNIPCDYTETPTTDYNDVKLLKQRFLKGIDQWLPSYLETHCIYFVTITFKSKGCSQASAGSSNKKLDINHSFNRYQDYFNRFNMRVNSRIATSKNKLGSAWMLMVPERSWQINDALAHFHGFLLVPKSKHQRFIDRCTEPLIYWQALGIHTYKGDIGFNQKILCPYSDQELKQSKTHIFTLQVGTTDVQKIDGASDISRVAEYIFKNFTRDFTHDEIIVCKK